MDAVPHALHTHTCSIIDPDKVDTPLSSLLTAAHVSARALTYTASPRPTRHALLPSLFPAVEWCQACLQGVMVDPVIAGDGHTYERAAIAEWLETNHTSPVTQAPLPHSRLVPNRLIKGAIATQRQQLPQAALA